MCEMIAYMALVFTEYRDKKGIADIFKFLKANDIDHVMKNTNHDGQNC